MAEQFELKGSINPANIDGFGNSYVDTLIAKSSERADALGNEKVSAIMAAYRNGATEKIDCADVTAALNSIDDDDAKLDLSRSAGAIVKHVRGNMAFGAKMKAFAPRGRQDRLNYAGSLLADLKARNVYPNTFTLNQVIRLCGSIEEAANHLEQIGKRGARPAGYTLTRFVQLATSGDQAQTMVEDFEMRGVPANGYVMNAHIKKADGVEASQDILKQYETKGLSADNATVAAIASNATSLQEALDVVEQFARDQNINADVFILNSVVKHATSVEEASDTVKRFAAINVERDNVTRSIFIKIAIDSGETDQAQRWIEQMETENLDPATRGVLRTYKKRLAQPTSEAAE